MKFDEDLYKQELKKKYGLERIYRQKKGQYGLEKIYRTIDRKSDDMNLKLDLRKYIGLEAGGG